MSAVPDRDLVRQVWADAGAYATADAGVDRFLRYFEEHPLECWSELVAEFRSNHYQTFAALVPPLLAADRPALSIALIRTVDLRRPRERAMLTEFAEQLDPDRHEAEAAEIRRRGNRRLTRALDAALRPVAERS